MDTANIKSTHIYEIDANGTLFKDDGVSFCPHPPPIMQVNVITGKPDLQRFPCNKRCPLAEVLVDETSDKLYYAVHCGHKELLHEVSLKKAENESDQEDPPQSKIINPLIST